MIRTLLALVLALFVQNVSAASVTVTLDNLNEITGTGRIVAWLYPNKENFPMKAAKTEIATDLESFESVTFENLEAGEYAVSIFVDKDNNKEIKTNWIGMPKEPIGVSNNVKGKMGPPKFKDAKFSLAADEKKSVAIKLYIPN